MPEQRSSRSSLARPAVAPGTARPHPRSSASRGRWLPLPALLLGLLHACTFAPWGNGWLQLAVLGGFGWLLAHAIGLGTRPGRLALLGSAFGIGWFAAGVGWLYVAMHDFGGLPAPLAAAGVLLFASYLSIYPALACLLLGRLARPGQPLRFILATAGAFTLAELLRGWVLTGFPWLGIGYAHIDSPLAALAPVGGVYAVTFAACLISASIAIALYRLRPWLIVPGLAVLAVANSLHGIAWTHPVGQPLRVSLLQGNIPQQMKFDPVASQQARHDYMNMIEAAPADLVLLPETAWTLPWQATDSATRERMYRFILRTDSAVGLGIPRIVAPAGPAGSPRDSLQFANSVLLLDRSSLADEIAPLSYDKQHLVPFGEFVPPGFRWFVNMMQIPLGDLYRGSRLQAAIPLRDQRIGFNICYEDIFGEELLPVLGDGHTSDSPERPGGASILANLTNLGWYGRSHALPQHLQIARMRSRETGRPMIRATNNGMTAIIQPNGQVSTMLPPHENGVLQASVQGHAGLTPYARAGGNLPVWLLAGLALLSGVFRCRPRNSR